MVSSPSQHKHGTATCLHAFLRRRAWRLAETTELASHDTEVVTDMPGRAFHTTGVKLPLNSRPCGCGGSGQAKCNCNTEETRIQSREAERDITAVSSSWLGSPAAVGTRWPAHKKVPFQCKESIKGNGSPLLAANQICSTTANIVAQLPLIAAKGVLILTPLRSELGSTADSLYSCSPP